MSEQVKELVILSTGECFIEERKRIPTTIPDGLLARYATETRTMLKRVIPPQGLIPDRPELVRAVHAAITPQKVTWVVLLNRICLRARIKVIEDGKVVSPHFQVSNADNPEPNVDLWWQCPPDLMLAYACSSSWSAGHSQYLASKSYLVALDTAYRTYRLPTSNVYENCELCTGTFNSKSDSHYGVIQKCLTQFFAGEWNSDLHNRGNNGQPEKLFRFKPNKKGEGFEQLPHFEDSRYKWPDYCDKVVQPVIQEIADIAKGCA